MEKIYEEIEEQTIEQCEGSQCDSSAELTHEGVTKEYEDATFSVLLAMVPLLVFTLFGQIGFF